MDASVPLLSWAEKGTALQGEDCGSDFLFFVPVVCGAADAGLLLSCCFL